MNNNYFALLILSTLVLTGCTSKQLYNSIQPKYTEAECRELPETQYEECLKKKSMSYEEYEKERQKVIKKDPVNLENLL
jgi:hypothetical protein